MQAHSKFAPPEDEHYPWRHGIHAQAYKLSGNSGKGYRGDLSGMQFRQLLVILRIAGEARLYGRHM